MAKRNKHKQTIHDKKVKLIADKLKWEGWNVEADIPGFVQPEHIGKENEFLIFLLKRKVQKK